MTSTHAPPAPLSQRCAALRFLRHYLEMVLVMIAGMLVLGSALALPAAALGVGLSEVSRTGPNGSRLRMRRVAPQARAGG
jgi:hypothetical protein